MRSQMTILKTLFINNIWLGVNTHLAKLHEFLLKIHANSSPKPFKIIKLCCTYLKLTDGLML